MNAGSIREAVRALRDGEVVLVPTETVVGLVASEAGLSRLWEIKGRDPEKPVALLCRHADEAFALAGHVPPLARKLANLYWPGPLTLVLDRPGGGTVGLRVPDHTVVQELLEAHGGPLYATSANLSGEPAPRSLDVVDPRVFATVDLVLEGEAGDGEASAVVDLSGREARILRAAGDLTEENLRRLSEER